MILAALLCGRGQPAACGFALLQTPLFVLYVAAIDVGCHAHLERRLGVFLCHSQLAIAKRATYFHHETGHSFKFGAQF